MAEGEGPSLTASVRIEVAPHTDMPEGFLVVPIERPGELVWVVREGEMSDALREQINTHLQHITHNGLWEQHFEGPDDTAPPGHPH
jgi:hypothetical protein